MKMKKQQQEELKQFLLTLVKVKGISIITTHYANINATTSIRDKRMRFAWDMLWAAKGVERLAVNIWFDEVYKTQNCNDTNIQTVLYKLVDKFILPQVKQELELRDAGASFLQLIGTDNAT